MKSFNIALTVLTVSLGIAAILSVRHQNERRDRIFLGTLTTIAAGGTVLSFFI